MLRRHSRLSYPGTSHFVTTVTAVRGGWFVDPAHCQHILEIFEDFRAKTQVICAGYVLMPDHVHALLLQPPDVETTPLLIPEFMRRFKQAVSRFCRPRGFPESTLWRVRYDDVLVPGSRAAWGKVKYMHYNPVKKGLAGVPGDYPWSSARDYLDLAKGIVAVERLGMLIE